MCFYHGKNGRTPDTRASVDLSKKIVLNFQARLTRRAARGLTVRDPSVGVEQLTEVGLGHG